MKKQYCFLLMISLLALFPLSSLAVSQQLQGYIYSQDLGWISLNCINTNSCGTVDYKVEKDVSGNLSGFGYSQNNEWVNFNPNYGGISEKNGNLSGWAYSENSGWMSLGNAKIVSISDLQDGIVSSNSSASLISSVCNKILSVSECNMIN